MLSTLCILHILSILSTLAILARGQLSWLPGLANTIAKVLRILPLSCLPSSLPLLPSLCSIESCVFIICALD